MFNIYYGRGNINREKFIYSSIMKEGWSASRPVIVLVPDQFTVEAEKQAFEYTGKSALIGLDIYGFSRLEHNIVKECGGGDRVFIDKYGEDMLISKVARELKDELEVFGNSSGKPEFIKLMSDFISEMKLYGATPDTVSEIIDAVTGQAGKAAEPSAEPTSEDTAKPSQASAPDALTRKLQDIRKIYTRYAEELEGKYTDAEDFTDLCVSEMGRSRIVKDSVVWVYGFDSFPPKYLDFIQALAGAAKDVNIVLTYDRNCSDEELFDPTGKVMGRLWAAAAEAGAQRGVEASMAELMPSCVEDKEPMISFMEHELYSIAPRQMRAPEAATEAAGPTCAAEGGRAAGASDQAGGTDAAKSEAGIPELGASEVGFRGGLATDRAAGAGRGGVHIVEAANINNEVETAAAFILGLVRDRGYRYRDILVMAGDMANTGPVIRRCFDEYGLPAFFDEKRSILNSNAAVLVISVLTAVQKRFRSTEVFKALKTGMLGFEADDIEKLENYVIKYRINGRAWLHEFTRGTFEYAPEELEAINKTRADVVALLAELRDITEKKQTTREFLVDFYGFMTQRLHITDRIYEEAERQADRGLMDLAQETVQIWGLIKGLMDQIAELIGEEPFALGSFIDILTTGLTGTDVGVIPDTPDDLMIGTLDRTMSGKVKAAVIIGANDGVIPPAAQDAGILTAEEIDRIGGLDFNICADRRTRAKEADLTIYRDFVTPSDILWIGYCDSDSEGRAVRPSELVRTIRDIFPDLKIERDIVSAGDPMALVGGKISTMRHYSHEVNRNTRDGGHMGPVWNAVGAWYSEELESADSKASTVDSLAAVPDGGQLEWTDLMAERPAEDDPDRDGIVEVGELLKSGKGFANDPEDLGSDLAEIFFNKNGRIDFKMSPSQLEAYTKCPFMHFVTFGLKPEERRVYEASRREIGDVCHESVMRITDRLTAEGAWDKVTDDDIRRMVRETLKGEQESYRDALFSYTNDEKYRSSRLEKLLVEVVKALVSQANAGQIKKSAYELAFGRGRDESGIIEPVTIDAGGRKITLTGQIDRVDILENGSVKIIDYKTGSPEVKPSLVKAGYALQLMAYLEAACGSERKPAGIFYFYIKEPDPSAKGNAAAPSPEELAKSIRHSYRMKGLFSSDPETIHQITGDESGYSDVINVRINKDGDYVDSHNGKSETSMLTDEEFSGLRESARQAAEEIAGKINSGSVKIRPAMISRRSTCIYCKYRNICQFDERFDGCGYNVIK
ncbi:MAG: exodeoxyribonuclease V subunit gamma [Eubacteriales bacterium]|nr:exodeoxyribonuclease V subunit gamma [Eubacteriales bacterium]